MTRRLWRLFRLGAIVLAITIVGVIHAAVVARLQHMDGQSLTERADALVVLGGGVDAEGDLGFTSKLRVLSAVTVMRDGWAGRMIMSDGSPGRDGLAAGMMADFAARHGAEPGLILRESRSRSTFGNMRFSARVLDENGLSSVILLTDEVHLTRARVLAWHAGLEVVGVVASGRTELIETSSLIQYVLREAGAWWFNLGKIVLWEAMGLAGIPESDRPERW